VPVEHPRGQRQIGHDSWSLRQRPYRRGRGGSASAPLSLARKDRSLVPIVKFSVGAQCRTASPSVTRQQRCRARPRLRSRCALAAVIANASTSQPCAVVVRGERRARSSRGVHRNLRGAPRPVAAPGRCPPDVAAQPRSEQDGPRSVDDCAPDVSPCSRCPCPLAFSPRGRAGGSLPASASTSPSPRGDQQRHAPVARDGPVRPVTTRERASRVEPRPQLESRASDRAGASRSPAPSDGDWRGLLEPVPDAGVASKGGRRLTRRVAVADAGSVWPAAARSPLW